MLFSLASRPAQQKKKTTLRALHFIVLFFSSNIFNFKNNYIIEVILCH